MSICIWLYHSISSGPLALEVFSCEYISIVHHFELSRVNRDRCSQINVVEGCCRILATLQKGPFVFDVVLLGQGKKLYHINGLIAWIICQEVWSYQACWLVVPLNIEDITLIYSHSLKVN